MKAVLHLALNLVIVTVYMAITKDYLISFSDNDHGLYSISAFIVDSLIAATLVIYVSYPFNGTKEHRTQFSLLILGVAASIVIVDKLIL